MEPRWRRDRELSRSKVIVMWSWSWHREVS
jgi:hypothetical protein